MTRRSPHRGDYPSLLGRVVADSLEPDYEMVARRAQLSDAPTGDPGRGRGGRPSRGRLATGAVLAAFVVLIVAASLENREDAPADALVRETLISTANERRDALASLQEDLAAAREENTDLASRSRQAERDRATAIGRLRRVAAASGFQAVTGPGLRLVLNDAPQGAGGELIRSDDLALLIDGLWEAGAEAIDVNGERLTARSATTTANVSINVNRRPVTSPYTVRAIGDPETLEDRLEETQGGGAWLLLVDEFSFGYRTETRDDLELPAARELLLTTCGACYSDDDDQAEPGGPP